MYMKLVGSIKRLFWSTRNADDARQEAQLKRLSRLGSDIELKSADLQKSISNQAAVIDERLEHIQDSINAVATTVQTARSLPVCGDSFSHHDGSKKQVLLVGYYGAKNYGDELMLSVMYKQLLGRGDTELSIMMIDAVEYNFDQWKDARLYRHPETDSQLENISGFYDEVILGGGAHIDDSAIDSYDFIPYLMIELSLLMIAKGRAVKWLAVSSNKELKQKKYIDKLQRVIGGAEVFSLRDTNSLDTLKRAKIDTGKVVVVDDIAFSVNAEAKILGVTLIDYFNDTDTLVEYCQDIVNFIKDQTVEWKVCLIPFYNENHADTKMHSELISRVDWRGVEVFIGPEYENTESMLLVIKACDAMINMRYHASLLGLMFHIPTASICYDIHPHYYNKITYLHDKYNSPNIVQFSTYKPGDIYSQLAQLTGK